MSAPGLFIYFRVARENEAVAVAALRELHAAWAVRWPRLACELMRRCDEPGDAVTLMEIYRGVTAEQRPRLEAEASRAVSPWLIGSRHAEAFEPCA